MLLSSSCLLTWFVAVISIWNDSNERLTHNRGESGEPSTCPMWSCVHEGVPFTCASSLLMSLTLDASGNNGPWLSSREEHARGLSHSASLRARQRRQGYVAT